MVRPRLGFVLALDLGVARVVRGSALLFLPLLFWKSGVRQRVLRARGEVSTLSLLETWRCAGFGLKVIRLISGYGRW